MMTKPRKLGNLRLARLARDLVGTEKLVLRFDHQEYGDIVRIAVDSDWAGSEERHSTHAGLEFHGEHIVDSWVASDQVRAVSFGEAELYGIVDGSARGSFTKHMYEEMGTIHQHRCRDGLDGCDRDVFPNGRRKDQTYSSSLVVDPRRHS